MPEIHGVALGIISDKVSYHSRAKTLGLWDKFIGLFQEFMLF
jgi:hypothetical protein